MSDKQPTQLKIEPSPDDYRSNIKQPTRLKHLKLNEISKLLWIKFFKNDFISLIKDVNDNLEIKDYQTKVGDNNYNLKNAEEYLLEIITKRISKDEALRLYNDLIKPDVDALEHAKKGKSKNKRNNIFNISNNIDSSVFDGVYFHYKTAPKKTEYEKSIAETAKLRRQRLDEVKKREENINNKLFNYYFKYSIPSNMISRLSDAKGELNKEQVYFINKQLTKIKNIVKNMPKDNKLKTKENEKIIDVVERIVELNNENQLGEGLKILTPDQMLSRLPITLAQLKAGNNSEKLINEIRQLLYSLYRSK